MNPNRLSWAILLALGCTDPSGPADPLDVRVSPLHVFAGGEVFLSGDWYRDSSRAFQLSGDTVSLAVRRVSDSTIAVALPASANGPVVLAERIDGADVLRGVLEVYGFDRSATLTFPIEAQLTPSRNPALPFVVTGDSVGISVIDLRSDRVTRYPGIGRARFEGSGCHRIVGPTYQDAVFLVWDSLVTWPPADATRWQLVPDTARGGAVPQPFGCGRAEVSPQVYVTTGSEGAGAFASLDSIDTAGTVTHFFSDVVIGNKGFHWSGNRMVLSALNHAGTGVIDLQNRRLAFRVPSINDVLSAAFSPDGSVIYLCGQGPGHEDVMVAVGAAAGDSLGGIAFRCRGLAVDPVLGLVYGLTENAEGLEPQVVVFAPGTLQEVGRIDVPVCRYCSSESVLLVDRATLDLSVVYHTAILDGVGIAHVRLPPDGDQ